MRRIRLFLYAYFGFLFLGLLGLSRPAYADLDLVARGMAKTFAAVLETPKGVITGAGSSFPLGIIPGAITGTMRTVAGTVMGAADIARGAAPYAKYLVFMI